ncbi:hypothetical protein LX36DRAFT_408022 [Colletotrichum falcatum]|nr:hypothetical protein LX36DRAFT_408022 [Colletotrichum falcatum]
MQPVFVDTQLGPSLRNDLIRPGRRILPDPQGNFQCTAVMCCQRGMQSRLHLSSTSTHRLCRLFPSFGGARIQVCVPSSCVLCPLGLRSPTIGYHAHCTGSIVPKADRDGHSSFVMSYYLDGVRKAMLSAQADSPCAELHRLESILHACPCVIHWPTPVSQRMSWDLPTPEHQTPPCYRPRVSVHIINPPVGPPLFAHQCRRHCTYMTGSTRNSYLVVSSNRPVTEE